MPSVLGDGAAVPADPAAALPLDGSLDPENLSSDQIKRAVRAFITEFSTLEKLTSCGSRYLPDQGTWNACRRPLCWQCSHRRGALLAAELIKLSADYPTQITMTLSLATAPSTSLRDAWDALDAVRGEFTAGRWLTSRITAYRWHTELTKGPTGWHPHVAFLLVSRNVVAAYEFAALRDELLDRWAALATARDLRADADQQHAEKIRRTPGRAVSYLTKGPMRLHGESRTAGRILLDAAVEGDAEAAADWAEIEEASAGRRWQSTGGEFRERRAPAPAYDPEADPSVPFSVAWINASVSENEMVQQLEASPLSTIPAFFLRPRDVDLGIARSRPGRQREASSGGQT